MDLDSDTEVGDSEPIELEFKGMTDEERKDAIEHNLDQKYFPFHVYFSKLT